MNAIRYVTMQLLVLLVIFVEAFIIGLYWLPVRLLGGINTFDYYRSERDGFGKWLDRELL